MAAHRRPLVTSAIAGGLLCALWFVPTAKTSPDAETLAPTSEPAVVQSSQGDHSPAGEREARLAGTGDLDTKPYQAGELAFRSAGAGLVAQAGLHPRPRA